VLIEPAQNHGWVGTEVPLQFERQCGDLESIIYEGKMVPNNVLGISVILAAAMFTGGFKSILTKRFRAK